MSSTTSPKYTYDASIMQAAVDASSEPAFRANIINTLNKQCAENKYGLVLRIPQPNLCHCMMVNYSWTDDEVTRYTADGTLPRNLVTVDQTAVGVSLWIIDARNSTGVPTLPELELDPLPDFEKHRAICVFDMDDGKCALIPSEFLEMVPKGGKRVQFVLKEERQVDQFVPEGGLHDIARGL